MTASSAPAIAAESREEISLLRHFAKLDEPRQSAKILYPLPEIVLLVISATIADCDGNVEICAWGHHHLEFLRRYLPFADAIPSHDALGDVLNAIDPAVFEQCFIDWITELRDDAPDIIAIDGKTSRRTHDRSKGRKALHLVSASWRSHASHGRPRASGSCSGSRRRRRNPTRSRPFPFCSTG